MSEKRFTIAIDSNNLQSLWDENRTEEEPLLFLDRWDNMQGVNKVCELLNELNDENEELKQQYHKLNNKLHSIESILEDLGSKKYISCDERLQVLNEISKVMWNDY